MTKPTTIIDASGKTPEQVMAEILQQYTARVHDAVLGEAIVERTK